MTDQQTEKPHTRFYVRPKHDKAGRFEVVNGYGVVRSTHKTEAMANAAAEKYRGWVRKMTEASHV